MSEDTKKPITEYNREKEWKTYCEEHLRKIIQYCSIYQIPCFFTVAVANDENGTTYVNDGVMTGSTNVHLKEDRMKYHMMVASGCRAVPTDNSMTIDMDILADPVDPESPADTADSADSADSEDPNDAEL